MLRPISIWDGNQAHDRRAAVGEDDVVTASGELDVAAELRLGLTYPDPPLHDHILANVVTSSTRAGVSTPSSATFSQRFAARSRKPPVAVRVIGVVAVQRTDSALRPNVYPFGYREARHFHSLVLDGVYVHENGDPRAALEFRELDAPTQADIIEVAARTAARVEKILRAHGRSLDPELGDDTPPKLALDEPGLAACYDPWKSPKGDAAAAQGLSVGGARAARAAPAVAGRLIWGRAALAPEEALRADLSRRAIVVAVAGASAEADLRSSAGQERAERHQGGETNARHGRLPSKACAQGEFGDFGALQSARVRRAAHLCALWSRRALAVALARGGVLA